MDVPRRLTAELTDTAGLLATVIGSGNMAERLAGRIVAIALLGNTPPTEENLLDGPVDLTVARLLAGHSILVRQQPGRRHYLRHLGSNHRPILLRSPR